MNWLKLILGVAAVGIIFLIGDLFLKVQENPYGILLDHKDYEFEEKTYNDSIVILTGSTVLISGSGTILSETESGTIVADINYQTGSVIIKRKVAISPAQLTQLGIRNFEILLLTGGLITDVNSDTGELNLFSDVSDKPKEKIFDEINLVAETESETSLNPIERLPNEDSQQIASYPDVINSNPIKKNQEKENTLPIPPPLDENFQENEEINSNLPSFNDNSTLLSTSSSSSSGGDTGLITEPDPVKCAEFMWEEDTDESNYQLAICKEDPWICDRLKDPSLKYTCKETLYYYLGTKNGSISYCKMLENATKKQDCLNILMKESAIKNDRIAKCMEIKNDDQLVNSCIGAINQNLYDAAIEQQEPTLCNAIYNSTMQVRCLMQIEGN